MPPAHAHSLLRTHTTQYARTHTPQHDDTPPPCHPFSDSHHLSLFAGMASTPPHPPLSSLSLLLLVSRTWFVHITIYLTKKAIFGGTNYDRFCAVLCHRQHIENLFVATARSLGDNKRQVEQSRQASFS